MNRTWVVIMVILGIIFGTFLYVAQADAKERPLPYKIDTPHIVEKNHQVLIEWRQTERVLVTVYKLSWDRQLKNNCDGVETFFTSCEMLWQKYGLYGNIRVTDRNYKSGDEYYIQQNVYQTHNGAYGPFYPTYR